VTIAHPALLPLGFTDLLPPHAAQEAGLVHEIIQLYHYHGYARVSPPLLEFEETLLAGSGTGMAAHSFRLTDPLSGAMLALRADMTVQVARIATTRLAAAPRPLRLAYAGYVVRQNNSEHRPQRQSGQVGLELIGTASPAADAEIIRLACHTLQRIGIHHFTLDLSLPSLVTGICQAYGVSKEQSAALRHALDRKDAAAVQESGGECAALLLALLRLSGPLPAALAGLQQLSLPPPLQTEIAHLVAVHDLMKTEAFAATIMLDLVEHRGFEYNSGLAYTLFAHEPNIELGRGGRYHSKARDSVEPGEPATGFTFYSENLLAAMPLPVANPMLYLPYSTPPQIALHYQQQGFVTVQELEPSADAKVAASRQGCSHLLQADQIIVL
jgi:ATP phosphoribosyltransferase regulatory subunit